MSRPLTQAQVSAISYTIVVTSVLSLCGCTFIIYRYHQKQKLSRQDFSSKLVYTLAIVEFCLAVFRLPGRTFIDYNIPCQIQAFLIDSFNPIASMWNACMATNLYFWVARGHSEDQLRSKYKLYLAASILPTLSISIYHLIADHYGDADYYCWIKVAEKNFRLVHYCAFIILPLIYIILVIGLTIFNVRQRGKRQLSTEAEMSANYIQKQFFVYICGYIVLYTPMTVFRILQTVDIFIYVLALFAQALNNLQGFLNAIIYGGLCEVLCLNQHKCYSNRDSVPSIDIHLDQTQSFSSDYTTINVLENISIFTTSFNMGEGAIPDNLSEWIPLGHHVYVIGVQECLDISALRKRILMHLEVNGGKGGKSFAEYSREIGSRNTVLGYHGYIAISVFVSCGDVASGVFSMNLHSASKISCGKSYGIGRASNKGAVGFSFRYYDTTFAVVSCHLASDSKGKCKLKQRNQNAVHILNDMRLSEDDGEFNFNLMSHHTIVMGDLNYRLTLQNAPPKSILRILYEILFSNESSPFGGCSSKWSKASVSDQSSYSLNETPRTCSSNIVVVNTPIASDSSTVNKWQHLLQHDELQKCMSESKVFHNFHEAPITFAPTYRRVRNTLVQSSSIYSFAKLKEAFSTEVSGASRVPSYTDRILYHSLSDMRDRLLCVEYFNSERIQTSDHKPVSCVFECAVNKNAQDNHPVVQMYSKVPTLQDYSGIAECTVSITKLQIQWYYDIQSEPSDNDIDVGDMNLLEAPHCSQSNYTGKTTESSNHASAIENAIEFHTIFPLPCEDSFAQQRRLHELAGKLTRGMNNKSKSNLLAQNHQSTNWTIAIQKGIIQVANTFPDRNMHIAINIRTQSGSLGQCVLSLDEAYQAKEYAPFQSALIVGGKKTGILCGNIALRIKIH